MEGREEGEVYSEDADAGPWRQIVSSIIQDAAQNAFQVKLINHHTPDIG